MKNLNYLIVLSSLFLLGCNNEKETPLLYTVATEKFEVKSQDSRKNWNGNFES